MLLAILLAVLYGRYWAPTDQALWLSRIGLPRRSARAVSTAKSRRRVVPVMTETGPAEDGPRPRLDRRRNGEALPPTTRAEA